MEQEIPLEVQEHVTLLVYDTPDEVIHLHTVEEKQKLIDDSKLLVIKLGAEWCGPCEKIMPAFKQLAFDYKEYSFVFASEDVDLELDLNPIPIKSIPAFHFYRNGTYVSHIVGANLEALETEIKNFKEELEK